MIHTTFLFRGVYRQLLKKWQLHGECEPNICVSRSALGNSHILAIRFTVLKRYCKSYKDIASSSKQKRLYHVGSKAFKTRLAYNVTVRILT